jgi:hypothetical protein
MRNQGEAGGAMFIERSFPKVQYLFKGIKEGILRHKYDSHIILGNVKFQGDSTGRTNRGTYTCSSSRHRSREGCFTERERKHA